jgi:phosphoglycolate phosphatase-like HAD superfamily hydrolase
VYVGDRAEDIVAARTAGLLSIAALWFAKEDAQITVSGAQPDFSVIQPSALFETVMQVRRQEWAKQRSL